MPEQIVFKNQDDSIKCEYIGCQNYADVKIKFPNPYIVPYICIEHAHSLAQQLMKVTSKETTTESTNER